MSAPPDPPAVEIAEAAAPRRLDPRTLIVKLLKEGPAFVVGASTLLFLTRRDNLSVEFFLVAGALVVAAMLGGLAVAWLSWRSFTYQILPDQIVIARGRLHRSRRSIPAERIQDVSIEQKPLARLFGLAVVRIETGGGEADEGRLDSVTLAEAHRLRDVLRRLRRHASAEEADTETLSETEAGTTLFHLSPPRLVLSGLFSFSLVWLAAVFAVYEYADRIFDLDWQTILGALDLGDRDFGSWEDLRIVLAALGATLVLGVAAGLVRTVLRDWNFRLAQGEGRFRVRRGLLSRSEVVVAERQIQLGLIEHGVLAGAFGWRALRVQTLGGGGGDGAAGRQVLLPFNRAAEVAPVVARAGLPPFEPAALLPVSPRHAVPGLVWFVLVPGAVVGAASLAFPPAALLFAFAPFALAAALLRSRRHRYALAPTSVQVRRGVYGRRDWTTPYGTVQVVTVRRGPWQRRMGVATFRIDTAGGRAFSGGPHVHDLDEAVAAALARDLLDRVHASAPPTRVESR